MEDNEKKQISDYELEWSKLREEYKKIMATRKRINIRYTTEDAISDMYIDVDAISENLEKLEKQIKEEPKNTENADTIEDIEKELKEIRKTLNSLKTEKDYNIKLQQETKIEKMFTKIVDVFSKFLTSVEEKNEKLIFWNEENKRDFATGLVVLIFVLIVFFVGIMCIKIPEFMSDYFYLKQSYDIITSENMVYVDEDNREYHKPDCLHIKGGMRYLMLQENTAQELGFKECEYGKYYK